MNVLIITSIVVAVTLAIGTGLASIFVRLSNMVVAEQEAAEKEKSSYNPGLTKGHKVPVEADFETQLKEARLLAAKKAAVTPRGANMRIGQLGAENQPTAFDGIDNDPITTVRVAHFHGWNILRTGAMAGVQAAGAVQAGGATAAPTKRPEDLVPGKDYEYIRITDEMDPGEVRRARIANAKAKAAAVKALKAAGGAAGPGGEVTVAAAPALAQAAQPQAAAPVVTGEPVEGVDYQVIEITDDMSPDQVRKARIANSKAKAAAFKAFKESGGAAAAAAVAPVPAAAPAAQPAVAAAPAPAAQSAAVPSNVPRPDFIEITDDMDPADIRKARIANAKAKSAYVKALKDAGIDPSTVDMP